MNMKAFHLFTGGVLIVALADTSPWTVISGVLFLWLVHRRAVGTLSKIALFRSVAAGGIAGGFIVSTLVAVIPFLVKGMFALEGHNPVDDAGLFLISMRRASVASAAYSVLASLLFAWSATLIAPYLPVHQGAESVERDA